jgi:membrane glycosyltransferase
MSGNDRSGKVVGLIGSSAFEEAFQEKVRNRRWAVALVTFGISLLGLWLMFDVMGAGGWTTLKGAEVVLFGLLFTSLSFGFS